MIASTKVYFHIPDSIRCKYGVMTLTRYDENVNQAQYKGLLGDRLAVTMTCWPVDDENCKNLRITVEYPYPQGTSFIHEGKRGSDTFEYSRIPSALESDYEDIMAEYGKSKSKIKGLRR